MADSIEPRALDPPEDNFSEFLDRFKTKSMPGSERAPKARVEGRPVRQGLPSEYRMRHDAHYVEELATQARSQSQDLTTLPMTVPASVALRDICQEFEGLASCFNLLDERARPLRERIGLALAKVGIQRSVRYAQHLRVLLDAPHPLHRELRFDEVVRDALTDMKEELRLTESALVFDLRTSLTVRGDAGLLRTGLRACAGTTIGLIEMTGQAADLHVCAFASGDVLHCEFRQDACAIEPQHLLKMFDLESPERASRVNAVALNAARRVAQLHGGQLEARRTSAGGCVFIFSLPKAPGANAPITSN